ncbi:beta-lactamase superfamily domain-containing protein [Bombardia bombarda]|uniref:Beta-lactamase superfamily domain-containing protein n=1 Tax=Bombardia bombarda TaxID=252184 RepID=A0AA39XME2_9PEZI|nr:beta-lactamase superfamily domain-containing protein [Bombardia bombarda]
MTSATAYSCSVTKQAGRPAAPEDVDVTAHHVKGHNGETVKFKNPHPSASCGDPIGPLTIVPTIMFGQFTGKMVFPSVKNVKIPVVKPSFLASRSTTTSNQNLRATWLGHACYYAEFPSGLRVLFDPVFEDRCAPLQFIGPKRYSPPACTPADLPAVDAVVISHSHYDHLSHTSVMEIARRHPAAHFFVGLGLEKWFRACGIANVTEMDWWEEAELVLTRTTGEDAKGPESIAARISCLPCQHASGRRPLDRDHTLWASWAVASGGKSVYFGGDTGYRAVPEVKDAEGAGEGDDYGPEYEGLPRNPDFARIGATRGPFDLGLLPIGAYKPRWLFSGVHASPRDAVEIFKETRCKRAMAIHWGTWLLTNEDVEEPPRLLREALRTSGIAETGVFDVCAVGESREF